MGKLNFDVSIVKFVLLLLLQRDASFSFSFLQVFCVPYFLFSVFFFLDARTYPLLVLIFFVFFFFGLNIF